MGTVGISLISLNSTILSAQNEQVKKQKPNVLFIAVDDLKPLMAAYGDRTAVTPGLDKLSRKGATFQSCYVQQAISGASRASLLTGMRPDKTKVWDLVTDFRQVNPNAVSIPQHFISQGYEAAATGKIYHIGSAGPGHDAPSWTLPYVNVKAETYANTKPPKGKRGPATESADVPDNTYHDGVCAEEGIKLMQQLKDKGNPFFLAIGFIRPHLPFVAPKKYWDLYKREQFKPAPFQEKAANSPGYAYHVSGELKNYTDIPDFNSFSSDTQKRLSPEKQQELIHGYYAATSYMDAQLLKVLNELERLGLAENTIIVLWGDHGWHLGDHGLWNKHTNFEQATRVPLLISAPGIPNSTKPNTLCEFVDVFPTLCDLAGIESPVYLDGVSLVPSMKKEKKQLRKFALSQYPRSGGIMGYSIRTTRYRYTIWMDNYYSAETPFNATDIKATELYDYVKDPLETINQSGTKEYNKAEAEMKKLIQSAMEREHKQYLNYSKLANWQVPISTNPEKKGRMSGSIE